MSDGLRAIRVLPVATADLAVGVLLARHVSVTLGGLLVTFGVLVLLTVTYRTVLRSDRTGSRGRQPA